MHDNSKVTKFPSNALKNTWNDVENILNPYLFISCRSLTMGIILNRVSESAINSASVVLKEIYIFNFEFIIIGSMAWIIM